MTLQPIYSNQQAANSKGGLVETKIPQTCECVATVLLVVDRLVECNDTLDGQSFVCQPNLLSYGTVVQRRYVQYADTLCIP